MRLTGCGDPRVPVGETLEGKLPQRKIAQTAAAGYSSYGNQIGWPPATWPRCITGLHCQAPGVRRGGGGRPRLPRAPGGARPRRRGHPAGRPHRPGRHRRGTGSSKSHNKASLDTMASEVQKGNAPEERKIQRLFRKGEVTRMIKRCNDFGAGGVSVAIGELADGLEIDLDAVRKKYDGLDGTELAISESQERMAVGGGPPGRRGIHGPGRRGEPGGLSCCHRYREPPHGDALGGQVIAISPAPSLNTNGAVKHAGVSVPRIRQALSMLLYRLPAGDRRELSSASRRGLVERFDGSIGAAACSCPSAAKPSAPPPRPWPPSSLWSPARAPTRPASWPGALTPTGCPPTPTRGPWRR